MSLVENGKLYNQVLKKLVMDLASGRAGIEQVSAFLEHFSVLLFPEFAELKVSLKLGILYFDTAMKFTHQEQLTDSPSIAGYDKRLIKRQEDMLFAFSKLTIAYISAFRALQLITEKYPPEFEEKALFYINQNITEQSATYNMRLSTEERTVIHLLARVTFTKIPFELARAIIEGAMKAHYYGYICTNFNANAFNNYESANREYLKKMADLEPLKETNNG
jgi:hypothetical protein